MTHRMTLNTMAFATVLSTLGFAVTAHAQTRGDRASHVASQDGGGRISMDGRLGRRDPSDDEGHHRREQTVNLRRGDRVRFGVSSDAMDVVAVVEGPNGEHWTDDDGAGGTNARLVFTAPRDGGYRFIVTTYDANETGAYQAEALVSHGGQVADSGDDDGANGNDDSVDDGDDGSAAAGNGAATADDGDDDGAADDGATNNGAAAAVQAPGAGTTYGIFVGIANYGSENHALPGSDTDAVQLARTFQQAGWLQRTNAVVLTNAQATADGVRQAFRTLAPRVRPNDTLVFFFDGHGNRQEIEMVGDDLSRSELGQMMNRVHGHQLLVLDSCEAGGFAPLVQGHADRAGLFSSRATEESSTAPDVNSGGWLAWSFRQAVGGGVQRRADGSMDLNDVIAYVRRQYTQHHVTPEQNLVAVTDRSQAFALGGRGDAAAPVAANTAVASAQQPYPTAPSIAPMPSTTPAMIPMGTTANAGDGLFGNNDAFTQILGAGVGAAGQVLATLVK